MPTGNAFDNSPRIEPWNIAHALCNWLGSQHAAPSPPDVLSDSFAGSADIPLAPVLADDFRNGYRLRIASKQGLSLILLAVATFAGCLQTPPVPLHEANLTVLLDGEPAHGARVVLHPLNSPVRIWPQGVADVAGEVQLSAFRGHGGVPAGEYIATITWHKYVISGEDYLPGPNVIPEFYGSVKTSPLRVFVDADQFQPPLFTLSRCDQPGSSESDRLYANVNRDRSRIEY